MLDTMFQTDADTQNGYHPTIEERLADEQQKVLLYQNRLLRQEALTAEADDAHADTLRQFETLKRRVLAVLEVVDVMNARPMLMGRERHTLSLIIDMLAPVVSESDGE